MRVVQAATFVLTAALGWSQEVLPFPPTPSGSTPGLTMRDSVYKKRVEPKHLNPDAPNILIILMDDVGPAQPSTYGGEINTPTLTRIAQLGISYSAFHSTAMCSPTRGALLTGRFHVAAESSMFFLFPRAFAFDFDFRCRRPVPRFHPHSRGADWLPRCM